MTSQEEHIWGAVLQDQITGGVAVLPNGHYRVGVGSDFLRLNHVPLPIHKKRETMRLRELLEKFQDYSLHLPAVLESMLLHNVSDSHALLHKRGNSTYISDVSYFGTSLTRRHSKVYVSKKQALRLHCGDEINFGGWLVNYYEDSEKMRKILTGTSESKRFRLRTA